MKSFIFKIVVLSLLIYSCTEKGIRYTGITPPARQEIQGILLDSAFIFSYPNEIVLVDSLLIIRDYLQQDFSFHVFNKITGKHLKSFGKTGRGPGEVIYPGNIYYDRKDQTLTTMVSNLNKIIKYNLVNILSDKQPFFSEIKLNKLPLSASEIILGKDLLILEGFEKRFSIVDTNFQVLGQYYNYPELVPVKDENLVIFHYAPRYALHPSGKKMVSMTYIGGIMEIFDIQNNKITPNITKYFHEPIYRVLPDGKPKWIATVEKTIPGCTDIYGTEEYIYCIYEGEISKDPQKTLKKIFVFDWDGNLQFEYKIREGIPVNIAVDEKYIYSVITTGEGEYYLYKYSYKN